MKQLIGFGLGVVMAGCVTSGGSNTVDSPPPPVVTDLSPATGSYGTTITITGTGFTSSGSLVFAGVTNDAQGGAVVTSWTDTQIVARVPFPATAGAIAIDTSNGQAETPVFTPDLPWTAGDSASLDTAIAAQRYGTTTDVLGMDFAKHVQLISFGATTQTFMLAGVTGSTDDRKPTRARLAGQDHAVGNDAADHLIDFTVVNGALVATDTGLVGELLAADVNGAWLQAYDPMTGDYSISHAKPGATWTIDRGPIVTLGVIAAQITSDGTLVVAWSHPDGSIFDNMANVAVAHLAPAATALSTTEYPENTAWDDYIASIELAISPDGQRMLLAYASQENNKDFEVSHPALERATTGAWTEATGLEVSDAPIAFTTAGVAALADSADVLSIIPDITQPATTQPVPMWPAHGAALVTTGSALLPVIQVGERVWAPLPPVQ
jgi:hypothetical protein